jgi:hypothetical protein
MGADRVIAARAVQRDEELCRELERAPPRRRRAEPVSGAVVGLDRDDAAARRRDARELGDRRSDIGDVLQHRNGIDRIEHPVAKRQPGRIAGRELDALVMRGGLPSRGNHFRDDQIDADETNLRDLQTANGHLGLALTAADVQNPIARSWLQRFSKEVGEGVVPPGLTEVFQRGGSQCIDRRRHQSSDYSFAVVQCSAFIGSRFHVQSSDVRGSRFQVCDSRPLIDANRKPER